MATKLKDFNNIVRFKLPNGQYSPYLKNGEEAENWFNENYGKGYKVTQTSGDSVIEPVYQGGTLPEVEVSANAPADIDELQEARKQIMQGNYYGHKFTPTAQNVAHYLNLLKSDRQVHNATDNSKWAKFALANGAFAGGAAIPFATMPLIPAITTTVGAAAGSAVGEKAGTYLHHQFVNPNTTIGETVSNWWNHNRPSVLGHKLPSMDASTGELANVGTWVGGAVGGFVGNHYVPKAIYADLRSRMYHFIDPAGYGGHGKQIGQMALSYLNPKSYFYTENTIPQWHGSFEKKYGSLADPVHGIIPSKAFLDFRDAAYRKALRFKPRSPELDIYIPNGDGTFRYDMDKVNALRLKYGGTKANPEGFLYESTLHSPESYRFRTDLKVGESMTGFDAITHNGGQVSVTRTPEGLEVFDIWDLNPFSDEKRLPFGKFGKWMYNRFPSIQDFEVIKAVNGNPFIYKQNFNLPQLNSKYYVTF